jgi:hypothetical protein
VKFSLIFLLNWATFKTYSCNCYQHEKDMFTAATLFFI